MFDRNKMKCKMVSVCFAAVATSSLCSQICQTEANPILKVVLTILVTYFLVMSSIDFYWHSCCRMVQAKDMNEKVQIIGEYHGYSSLRNLLIAYLGWAVVITYLEQGRPIAMTLAMITAIALLIAVLLAHYMCRRTTRSLEYES